MFGELGTCVRTAVAVAEQGSRGGCSSADVAGAGQVSLGAGEVGRGLVKNLEPTPLV